MKDLFETPQNMPAELRAIFQRYAMQIMRGASYEILEAMHTETLSVGFTFDYYLDAHPYGLRPIGTPLSALEGFEKELTNETF
jgi:hypothetical protein